MNSNAKKKNNYSKRDLSASQTTLVQDWFQEKGNLKVRPPELEINESAYPAPIQKPAAQPDPVMLIQPDRSKLFGMLIGLGFVIGVGYGIYSLAFLPGSLGERPLVSTPRELVVAVGEPDTAVVSAVVEAPVDVVKEEIVPVKEIPSFNPAAEAGQTNLAPAGNELAFIEGLKSSGEGRYLSVARQAVPGPSVRQIPSRLSLRSIPDSNGRYLASDGAEWQAGFQFKDPQGNLSRAKEYQKYLDRTFGRSTDLVSKELGRSDIAGSLP